MAMIKEVIESILDISPLTVVSHGNVRNKSLRRHLLTSLKSQTGDSDGFLAEPFFEGMFPWTNADRSLQEMVSKGEIGRMAVDAIRSAMPEMERLRKHQAESLKAIRAGKSIVVTTGTGSGKTECFLYPIIDALAKELEGKQDAGLDGVRALFLYPLNALIESQRERFKKLCDPFGGRIRFALYNGNTPDQGRSNDSEMKCRKEIRAAASGATPPNLLITNSTMLELALVRPVDRHIFEKSRGRLQFVVLDEAHTYLGSDAAELAMRLRRTLDAFGVAAENVRFIATSATTGTDTDSLREFLARIAGIPSESVEVIGGARYLPSLPKPSHPPIEPTEALEMLRQAKDGNASFEILVRTPKAIELRSHLLSKKMELGEIASSLGLTKSESLEFIDKASVAAQTERPSSFFLPVKIHLFQRAFHGVWACWNPECTHKQTELGDDWKFGRIHLTGPEPSYKADGSEDPDWDKCSCGSSVFEVVYCGHCGEVHLAAQMKDRGDGDFTLRVPGHLEDVEEASDDLIPDDQEETDETKTVTKNLRPALIPPAGEIANVRWNQNGEVGPLRLRSKGFWVSTDSETPLPCCTCKHPIWLRGTMAESGAFPFAPTGNLRSSRTSAKALYHALARTVVRADDAHGGGAANYPLEGRRMLGFTDSRQGTAYNAASQGLHAEMSATRVWLFHALLDKKARKAQPSVQDELLFRKHLEPFANFGRVTVEQLLDDPNQRNFVAEQRVVFAKQRGAISADSLSFEDAKSDIAGRITDLAYSLDQQSLMKLFHLPKSMAGVSVESLAELFLWREITFRARRKRSLETLGLLQVEYDLDRLIQIPLENLGQNLDLTRNFLKILLDYGLRAQGCVQSKWEEEEIKACYGSRASKREFHRNVDNSDRYAPGASDPGNRRWIELLAETFLTENKLPNDWRALGTLFSEALRMLEDQDVLSNKLLKQKAMKFRIPDQVWVCPITGTLLDAGLGLGPKMFSPYSVSRSLREPRLVESAPIALPSTLKGFLDLRSTAEDWWTDLHQELLVTSPNDAYLVAQEHSAQLDKDDLLEHQKRFSEGKVNLLNCSTTMEMGVDIGAISMVAMTNVPPYSHNYLQRAGRAGRGNQGQSLVWTISGAGSHDRLAWQAPLEWVSRPSISPHVNLDSAKIVQRHVNSWLLATWARSPNSQGVDNPIDWFLGYTTQGGVNLPIPPNGVPHEEGVPADHLNQLCRILRDQKGNQDLSEFDLQGLFNALEWALGRSAFEEYLVWMRTSAERIPKILLSRTQLDGASDSFIKKEAIQAFESARDRWVEDIKKLLEVLSGMSSDAGKWRLVYELGRLASNPVFPYLAEKGALPLNGLPVEVVQLSLPEARPRHDDSSAETSSERSDQFDRKARFFNLPSRHRSVAIREYAPGCGVILDGRVHTVRWIVRNWKVTGKGSGFSDPQTLRDVRLCHKCGAARVSAAQMGAAEAICPECGENLTNHMYRKMLVPSGFVAETRVTRSVEDVKRSSYESPRVGLHATAIRSALPNGLGEVAFGRATIAHLNGGGWEKPRDSTSLETGYSMVPAAPKLGPAAHNKEKLGQNLNQNPDDRFHVCMICGFSKEGASDKNGQDDPLKDHERWDKEVKRFVKCDGAAILPGDHRHQVVSLGALQETDAFAIRLNALSSPIGHRKAAFTWALALRNALAENLGIRPEEIGWTARGGEQGWTLVLFDHAPGGAEFSTKAAGAFEAVFRSARQKLSKCNCEKACHRCLLSRETQHSWMELDRTEALEIFDEQFEVSLGIPERFKIWGESTRLVLNGLNAELFGLTKNGAGELRIFLQGDPVDWRIEEWPLADHLRDWRRGEGRRLSIVMDEIQWSKLEGNRYLFASLMQLSADLDGKIEVRPKAPRTSWCESNAPILAEFEKPSGIVQFAALNLDGRAVDVDGIGPTWASSTSSLLLQGVARAVNRQISATKGLGDLYPKSMEIVHLKRGQQWTSSDFATRLLGSGEIPKLLESISGVRPNRLVYTDIYLKTPLGFRLLLELVRKFDPENVVVRNGFSTERSGTGWWKDYPDVSVADKILEGLLSGNGRAVSVVHPRLPHDRSLVVEYPDGRKFRLDLGKGLSYWEIPRGTKISGLYPNQNLSVDKEIERIAGGDFLVEVADEANLYAEVVK